MKKYIATAALCLATVLPTFAQTDIGNGFIMDDYILEYQLNRI